MPDILTHPNNPLQDESDDFDAIANYVFQVSRRRYIQKRQDSLIFLPQNSDANSMVAHNRDLALFRKVGRTISYNVSGLIFAQAGSGTGSLLLSGQSSIIMDGNGGLYLLLRGRPRTHNN